MLYELCFVPHNCAQLTILGLNATTENEGDSLVFNVSVWHNNGTIYMFAQLLGNN